MYAISATYIFTIKESHFSAKLFSIKATVFATLSQAFWAAFRNANNAPNRSAQCETNRAANCTANCTAYVSSYYTTVSSAFIKPV